MTCIGGGDELRAVVPLKSSPSPEDFASVFGAIDSFFDESLPHKHVIALCLRSLKDAQVCLQSLLPELGGADPSVRSRLFIAVASRSTQKQPLPPHFLWSLWSPDTEPAEAVPRIALDRENGAGAEAEHSTKKQAVDVLTAADEICIQTIRALGADLPQAANSGHPGAPMGMAPMAHALFGRIMKFHGADPNWINRDRFVLSNGHASALLYSMLHLAGYDLSVQDLKKFRQLHSKTPGHPENHATPGVEVTTGPLGQGIANAVGLALAAQHLASRYNKPKFSIFDGFVFVLCGDGCLQEGVASEACSLAGHLGLGRLIVLYDSNAITIDGSTDLSFSENVMERFAAYGWQTQTVRNGDSDLSAILSAVRKAKAAVDKPSIIRVITTIGFGSSKQGTAKVHGAPLGADDIRQFKESAGLDPAKTFQIPEETSKFYAQVRARNKELYDSWKASFKEYGEVYPTEKAELERIFKRQVDSRVEDALKKVASEASASGAAASTRSLSGKCLNAIKDFMPELIGGSADLTGSNDTQLKGEAVVGQGSSQQEKFVGRYIHFGVREHAMAAICNGLFAFGCFRPFAATFLNFLTYAWGAVRLSALSNFGVLHIMTHDSIELGEDGPTHQPVEVLPLIRATPNLLCARPADANETAAAYALWTRESSTPVVLCLCRGGVPTIQGSDFEKALKGGYVVSDFAENGKPKALLGGSGSELQFCLEAKKLLAGECDVRVVSMMCWEAFEKQTDKYKEEVLLLSERRQGKIVSGYVEASSTLGCEKYFDFSVGMNTFGASAPRSDCWKHFGFTGENVARQLKAAMKKAAAV